MSVGLGVVLYNLLKIFHALNLQCTIAPVFLYDIITGRWSLSPLLGVKIVHLLDRAELFKISSLVYDGKEIVRSLYSSLQGQTDSLWRV